MRRLEKRVEKLEEAAEREHAVHAGTSEMVVRFVRPDGSTSRRISAAELCRPLRVETGS